MNTTVDDQSAGRESGDYGPGVRAALAEHRIEPDTRIADVEQARTAALAEREVRDADWMPFDEGEYESDERRPDVLAAIERATDDGPGRDQHGSHERGPQYVADPAEYIGPPAPDLGAVKARQRVPFDEVLIRAAEERAHAYDGEPLEVAVSRIIRRRDVGAMSHEQAVKEIMAAFAKASPPVSAEGPTVSELTAERFGPTGAQA
jgi:hypothetical protein